MTWREDKALVVLCFFTVFFTAVTITVSNMWPNDAQVYTVFSGLLTGFAGALMMHLKDKPVPPPGSTITTTVEQTTKIPAGKTLPPVDVIPPAV